MFISSLTCRQTSTRRSRSARSKAKAREPLRFFPSFANRSRLRASMATRYPPAVKRRTMAAVVPSLTPVTEATLPVVSSVRGLSFLLVAPP